MRKHRWLAGLLMSSGMVVGLGVLTAAPASAQTTGSTTPNTAATTTASTVLGGSGGAAGTSGGTLAHTGSNSALPLEVAGGLLTVTLAGAGLLKKTRRN